MMAASPYSDLSGVRRRSPQGNCIENGKTLRKYGTDSGNMERGLSSPRVRATQLHGKSVLKRVMMCATQKGGLESPRSIGSARRDTATFLIELPYRNLREPVTRHVA